MFLDAWFTICTAKAVPAELNPPLAPMKKVEPLESPPVAGGLATVMVAVAGVSMSLAGIAACNCVLETKVVASAAPLNCTTAAGSNCAPLTVRTTAVPPAMAELGSNEGIVGFGGGVVTNAGAGPTKLPAIKKTRPLPFVSRQRNARPFCPQRIRRDNVPAAPGMDTEAIGVK